MAKITYEDKVTMEVNESIPNVYKVTSDDMNEIKDVVNANAVLTTLEDIGLSTYTNLDDLVNAVPNDTILSLYISTANATILYQGVGGIGNLPLPAAGLLVVKRQNNYWYVDYVANGGPVYHATKLGTWREWRVVALEDLETNGKEIQTGRIIDGKTEYVKRYSVDIDSGSGAASLGFTVTEIEITNLDGSIMSDAGNYFTLDYDGGGDNKIAVRINYSNNQLEVSTLSSNFKIAKVNVYYIKK